MAIDTEGHWVRMKQCWGQHKFDENAFVVITVPYCRHNALFSRNQRLSCCSKIVIVIPTKSKPGPAQNELLNWTCFYTRRSTCQLHEQDHAPVLGGSWRDVLWLACSPHQGHATAGHTSVHLRQHRMRILPQLRINSMRINNSKKSWMSISIISLPCQPEVNTVHKVPKLFRQRNILGGIPISPHILCVFNHLQCQLQCQLIIILHFNFHSWLSQCQLISSNIFTQCQLSVSHKLEYSFKNFLFYCQQFNAQCQFSVRHLAIFYFLCQQFNAQCQLNACLVVSLTKGQASEGYTVWETSSSQSIASISPGHRHCCFGPSGTP